MTDTPPLTPPLPPQSQGQASAQGLKGVLEGAPRDIRDALEQVRVQGQIKEARADGSVRIATPRGDVDLRIPPDPRTQPPQAGQVVEVDIPPQNPADPYAPRPVIIRAARPEASAQAPQVPPVNIQIQEQQQTQSAPQAPPLKPGDALRLQPLPQTAISDVQPLKPPETLQTQITAQGSQILKNFLEQAVSAPASLSFKPAGLVPGLPAIIDALNNQQNRPPVLSLFSSPASAFPVQNTGPVLSAPAPGPRPEDAITSKFSILPASFQTVLQGSPPPAQTDQSSPLQNFLLEASALKPLPDQTFTARLDALNPAQPQFLTGNTQQSAAFFTPAPDAGHPQKSDPAVIVGSTKPGEIAAKVTGVLQNNLPVISFGPSVNAAEIWPPDPQRSFILYTPLPGNITQGSELILTPQSSAAQPLTSQPLPPLTPITMLTPGLWPVMEEMSQQLFMSAPQSAQTMNAMAPSPGSPAQITPAALFFIAAFKAGDLQNWLGEKAIETLRQSGKGNLLQRLTQEGGLLQRLGAEPVSQDWRGLALPMSWQNEIHKIVIHYRQDEASSGDDTARGKGTRFVIDLNLSRMGKVQIDGLAREATFDAILRTGQPFSQAAQMQMKRLFVSALEVEGLTGALSFQNKPEQWVSITADGERFGVDI